MHGLIVLALGVDDIDGLGLVADHATITDLSTHFTIKRRIVKHQFIELVLLLGYLTVAKDMTFIFCIVVANKLLFTSYQIYPIRILNSSSIASTLFLFLHLNIKLLLIDGETILTTNEFRQIKRETISIKEAESLNTIKFGLALSFQLLHSFIKQGDTFIQRTQESIFFFLHHLRDELLLSFQFGESIAHLVNKCRNKFIKEVFLLAKERISITHSTTQNTTNHVTGLGIRGQLTIGNRERHGTEVIGANTHGNINIVLLFGDRSLLFFLESYIFQTRQLLLSLDNRLEHVCIIVRVLTLQHTHKTLKAHTSIDDVHGKFLK